MVDEDGNIECECDSSCNTLHPWTRLPITAKSSHLIATVPLKDGKPMRLPQTIEFIPQGMVQDVTEATEGQFRASIDIAKRIMSLEQSLNGEVV